MTNTVPRLRSDSTHQRLALAAALLGFFVVTLDALVVSVALPSISRDLGGGITGLQWVVDSYTLMFAALLLASGALADRVGADRAFAAGIALFVAASVACGLAPTLEVLILGRFIQGAGAAILMPASLALVRHAYVDPRHRARAIAIWAMGGAVASAAGPLAGGLATLVSWRLIFVINVPVGVVAVLLLMRVQGSPRRKVPFDWAGQVAAIVAMAALTYGLIEGGAAGFGAPDAVAALALAIAAILAFLVTESRSAHPMVPLATLRSRSVAIPAAVGFAFMVGFYGVVFLLSLYLQQDRGLTPLETGLVFLPMSVLVAVLNPPAARLAERIGARASITAGLLLMAAGLSGLLLATPAAATLLLAVLLIPVGLGGPLAMPAATAHILDSVPAHLAGTASGVLNTSRQLGGAIAIAAFGALLSHSASFVDGLHTSLFLGALVLVAAAAATLKLWTPAAPVGDSIDVIDHGHRTTVSAPDLHLEVT